MRVAIVPVLLLLSFIANAGTIDRVIWKSAVPIEDYRRLIKMGPGDPLSVKAIRRTVRLLYATGRFEQVAVSLSPGTAPDRVILTVAAQPLLFIDDIAISGNSSFSDNRIKLAGGLRRFMPFYESALDRIREEILFAYRSEGYPDAAASIEVRRISAATAELFISIREGERRKITRIRLEGTVLPSEKRELENTLTLSDVFSPLTDERVRAITDRVESYYRDREHLDISVRSTSHTDGTLLLTVNRGPRYQLIFAGNRAFSESTLRSVATHTELWHHNHATAADRLVRFYQAAGFPDARVAMTIVRDERAAEVTLSAAIEEGVRRFLDGVVFHGLAAEDSEEVEQRIFSFVRDRIETEDFPEIVLNRTLIGGGYRDTDGNRATTLQRTNRDRAVLPDTRYAVPAAYAEDVARHLETWYVSRGFLQAKVDSVALVHEGGLLYLDVSLQEGPRTTLTWVGFRSGDPELDDALASEMDVDANIPFDPSVIERTSARLDTELRARGYLFARVHPEQSTDGANVRLTFVIEDLFPVKSGELVVSGNAVTAEPVVRNLVRFGSGALLTTKLLHDARQDLLTTGAFDAAEISLIDEDSPADEKDIVITVTEAWRFRVDIGAGLSTDEGARLFGAFEYKNILGRVLTLRLSYKLAYKISWFMGDDLRDYFLHEIAPAERLDRTVSGTFLVPDLYFLPFSLGMQTEVFHIHDSRSASGLPYLLDKNGLTVTFYKRFGDHFFLSLNAELSRQDEETYHADLTGSDRFERAGRYLMSPGIEGWADYRDSPVTPDRGFKIGVRARNVTSLIGTNTKYTLLENYASVYLPLQYQRTASGDYEPRDTLIWHSFLKYAVLLLHAGTLTADDTLKLGGSTTVRGFGQNSLIPNDDSDGIPEGRYYLFLRNEMRLKIRDRFYVVAFFDAGNLWERIENIGKGDLLRYGTGGGLMFASPIGAINLQAGVNLFPREDPDRGYKEDSWSFHLFISSF